MPEGDTIHHAARRIRAVLLDRVPDEIAMPQPRHANERWPERLAGRAVRAVDAYGKHLFVRFEDDLTLHSHLRMTGSWGVHREGARWKRAARRAWIVIAAGEWRVVEFDGPVLELMSDARTRSDPRIAALGPDVIGERAEDAEEFLARLRSQDAGARDRRRAARPADRRGHRQRVEVRGVLRRRRQPVAPARTRARRGGEARSSTSRASACAHSAEVDGFSTRPQAVYKRSGRPCERCGTLIRSHGQGEDNRTTYWCPGCQL